MTFLNPFVLFGLAAAVIPLVLHLLNIRKLRTIEFSTLTFLKELQKSAMRRVKIRQWLLLILRMLLIILLVLGFSRPALKGTLAGLGTHANTTIVIILDDTYTMSLQDQQGSYLKQAQSCALRLLDLINEGDDAMLIRLSDLPQATIGEPTHDLTRLRDAVQQTQAGYKRRTIEDALRLSAKLLLQSKNFNKEIYILTDNQKTTLAGLTRAENRQPIQKLFDPNVRVFVVPLSEQTFENMGIVSVEVLPTLFQQGKPFTVRASIENYGTARVENHLVSLFLDGTRVMQKSLTLEGGGRTSVELTATPQHPGFFKGRVELEEDAFDEDNARYFSVDIPERINVLVSSSEPKSSAYLRLALSVHNEDETSTVLGFTEIPPQQLTYGALTKTDVVLLSNVASLSSTQADELNEFMSDGGGLIFFPGDRVNVAEYNSEVLSKLELPPLLPISPQTRSDVAVSFDKIDYDHPLFQGMFENVGGGKIQKREIESPKVYESSRFASEKNIRSIISLSDGTPFLWEKIGGTRRILGFAVAANTAWSDFPVKGIFVPLLYQTILYAASGRSSLGAFPSVTAGDRIAIPLSKLRTKEEATEPAASPTLRVLDPSGKESLVQPSTGGRMSSVVAFDNTEKPGVYVIAHGRDTLAEIPVNVDPAESEPARATKDEFLSLAEKMGIGKNAVTFVSNPGSIQSVVLQSRFGIELWKYFLLAALVVAVAEMIVAREPKE